VISVDALSARLAYHIGYELGTDSDISVVVASRLGNVRYFTFLKAAVRISIVILSHFHKSLDNYKSGTSWKKG